MPYVLYADRERNGRRWRDHFIKHGGFYNEVGDLDKAARFVTKRGAQLAAQQYGLVGMKPLRVEPRNQR